MKRNIILGIGILGHVMIFSWIILAAMNDVQAVKKPALITNAERIAEVMHCTKSEKWNDACVCFYSTGRFVGPSPMMMAIDSSGKACE